MTHVKSLSKNIAAPLFLSTGGLAIVIAGLLSAALAHVPSRHAMWTIAYLVLVVGVAQIVIGLAQWRHRVIPREKLALIAYALYNLGSIGTIVGTVLEETALVVMGALMIIGAMLSCLLLLRHKVRSRLITIYIFVVGIICVSAPIGMWLALR